VAALKIGIIGAMEEEISFFRQEIDNLDEIQKGKRIYYTGAWKGHDVFISRCGVGKVNAAITSQVLIDVFGAEIIIFTGVAGGAEENLNVGDVVISTSCQQHDIDASPLGFERGTIPMFDGPSDFQADKGLLDIAYRSALNTVSNDIKVVKGKIVSGDQFIADTDKVKQLRNDFSAACVEMEGAAVAQSAYFNNIPFVVIRSISDKANGEAAESFETFVNKAAENSAAIVEKMLKELPEKR
jgi:adenosylhomocysteine nucleosidase